MANETIFKCIKFGAWSNGGEVTLMQVARYKWLLFEVGSYLD